MPTYSAKWVVPIAAPPVEDGWVSVEQGRIREIGSGPPPAPPVDLGRVAILPALVNAHTHLELSYLRERVPPAGTFADWIREVMRLRREQADPADPRIVAAAAASIEEARAAGTGLMGDISNTLVSVPLLREAGMPAQVFYELLGFIEPDAAGRVRAAREAIEALSPRAGDVRISLAPHAPYSVSRELFAAIRADLDAYTPRVSTVHLAESAAEVELLARGTGEWKQLLQELGVWSDTWETPRASPAGYLDEIGFLDGCVLAVHGVQLEGEDLARLHALGATLVSCPRSNAHVGAGAPPLDVFYAMDVRIAFGTDSLASAPDLSVFAELAEARRLAPRVPARRLLESATLCGAQALGFGDELGSIEPGKRAALIAVHLPDEAGDVEEYLLTGVAPGSIAWIGRDAGADPAGTIAP